MSASSSIVRSRAVSVSCSSTCSLSFNDCGVARATRRHPRVFAQVDVPERTGERRWPAALAIVVLIAIPFLLPKQVFPRWLWATAPIELALLVALAIADPGRIDRRSRLLRGLSIVLTM